MLVEVYILNNNPKYPPLGRVMENGEYKTTVKAEPVDEKFYERTGRVW